MKMSADSWLQRKNFHLDHTETHVHGGSSSGPDFVAAAAQVQLGQIVYKLVPKRNYAPQFVHPQHPAVGTYQHNISKTRLSYIHPIVHYELGPKFVCPLGSDHGEFLTGARVDSLQCLCAVLAMAQPPDNTVQKRCAPIGSSLEHTFQQRKNRKNRKNRKADYMAKILAEKIPAEYEAPAGKAEYMASHLCLGAV